MIPNSDGEVTEVIELTIDDILECFEDCSWGFENFLDMLSEKVTGSIAKLTDITYGTVEPLKLEVAGVLDEEAP